MEQQVKTIPLSELVLWTENPRDPIDAGASDQAIVDRAMTSSAAKWGLLKLAMQMGEYYDFSELPTVVYHGNKAVVYDGNRRIALGKIKLGLVTVVGLDSKSLPAFPVEIPCNVCTESIALRNVYRKHADSGTWAPLERDIFLSRFMGHPKSTFLLLDEATGVISSNPEMNKRFVKEEIFKDETLKDLGVRVNNGNVETQHGQSELSSIFDDIVRKVVEKKISTRANRGAILDVLDAKTRDILVANSSKNYRKLSAAKLEIERRLPKTRRVKQAALEFFGGSISLQAGTVSNLYRDICDLYDYFCSRKEVLSQSFPGLIRMSLRLIAEAASRDKNQDLAQYLKQNFSAAKSRLSQDEKTTLSNHNVTETSIVQLLHTGAHNYTAASSLDQALAISIILGNMLAVSHGKAGVK